MAHPVGGAMAVTLCKDIISYQGGWKLVISDTCEIATRLTIILTAIEVHSERSTRFTQTDFVCLGRNSLSGYC